ncbi:fimbrial protein [Stenotrophomonas sp. S39]|uniref:fimbrial protein n=1 Tax=Stenotrophomonas sp. S39 TaxID=2767451 RepID=UPI00190B87E3|nr:fimbrial protein [Stenotrophomonas sp. S39]MBK0055243.1 fimbrial protein [Stenotrophomonas sp. S39]
MSISYVPRALGPAALLLLAASNAEAACRMVGGDAFVDHTFDVAYTPLPDQKIGELRGEIEIQCDSTAEMQGNILPAFSGVTYVRDVETDDGPAAGYQFGPGSPLLVFQYSTRDIGCVEPDGSDCPIQELWYEDTLLADGVSKDIEWAVTWPRQRIGITVYVYSRGDQMVSASRRQVATTTTRIGAAVGRHTFTLGVQFKSQTCAVSPQTVALDPVDARVLDQQLSAGEKPFNVAVNCGSTGRPLILQMSDVHDAASTGDLLVPAPGSSISGVGLQVIHDGAAVRMQHAWHYGTTTGGAVSVPFSARYQRTPGVLRGGSIRSEVSLLADYY